MEQIHPQAGEKPERQGSRLQLALEGAIVCGIAALLALVAVRIRDAQPDIGVAFAIAIGLHAVASVRFALRVAEFFEPS